VTRPLSERIAGAPITWGVCEVPGWGHQMSPERVLGEMAAVGLRATELGPDGFLPTGPAELRRSLDTAGLELVGAFVPLVLHVPNLLDSELAQLERQADLLAADGASVVVLAASTGSTGYESSRAVDDGSWQALVDGLGAASAAAASRGLVATLHPHYGTVIECPDDVDRLLEGSTMPLCLDTGHLAVGGADPLAVAVKAAGRIAHVHLKDVSTALSERVRSGRLGYREAVAQCMYRPLGRGDLDIAGVVSTLERSGYDGWYVLEQDTVVDAEPSVGAGPIEDARASYEFLLELATMLDPHGQERDAGVRAGRGSRGGSTVSEANVVRTPGPRKEGA
jgi:inosose dehydratase